MPESIQVCAPAKLNLFLHVIGRRPDGMHELQTLFQLLDYGDDMTFVHEGRDIVMEGDLATRDNLAWRAADLLRRHTGVRDGARIVTRKRIPLEAGLGGGSSDAAATLLVLNHLWGTGLQPSELAALGLSLGADVPVFVYGHSAFGEGLGEQLTPVTIPPAWYFVLRPACSVSTGVVFAAETLTRNTKPITIARLLGGGHNDCEPVVRSLYPDVDRAINWLSKFGPAKMTGSGSCVFVPVPDRETVDVSTLPQGWSGFAARGINESPVLATLQQPGRQF